MRLHQLFESTSPCPCCAVENATPKGTCSKGTSECSTCGGTGVINEKTDEGKVKSKMIDNSEKMSKKDFIKKYGKQNADDLYEAQDKDEVAESFARMRLLAGLPINEDDVTKVAVGHVDAEADMLRKELFKIGKYSVELYKMLGELPDGDFPHWWQAKIVKAGEYIGSAKHYLEGEMYAPEEESPIDRPPEEQEDINPSGI